MHVLSVTHRYPPQTGGVETHVREVAVRLVDRGHEVTVVSADRGGSGAARELRDGVRVRRVRAVAPGGAIHAAPGVCPAVRRHAIDADAVHVHNYHSLPFTVGALCAPDTRLVATPHYHGASDDPLRDRLLTVLRPLGRRALARADAVLAVSGWEREALRESFGVEPRVIPNGVVRDRFTTADPESRERPYLLTVGRLEPYKGIDDAIRAMPALPAYELCVAGSGPAQEELEALATEVGVADRVTFLGFVDDDRLPALYAGAAAHLQLSTHEAYGITVGESVAAGTPAVVREMRALRDWTDHRGVCGVTEPTPDTLAAAVRRAVDGPTPDPSSVPMWDDVTDRLLTVYRGESPTVAETD